MFRLRTNSIIWLAFATNLVFASPLFAEESPVRLIFDTDIGNDVDDALALAMIHALESRGECELLAVTVTKDNPLAAAYADAVNRFYGRGDIPIGLVRGGATPETGKFLQLAEQRDGGELRYPNRYAAGETAPDATEVLRAALANERDGSVVIIQVGFFTNLSRLLASQPDRISALTGRELVRQKVRLLLVMGGAFEPQNDNTEANQLEYNIVTDIPAAQYLVEHWPTPIEFSGLEIGLAIEYPAQSILEDYRYVSHHPIAEAYVLHSPPPHNRPTWDLTCVLHAVRPQRGYFGLSPPGRVSVADDGRTIFRPEAGGPHRLLTVSPEQIIRAREAFVQLSSQPPSKLNAGK